MAIPSATLAIKSAIHTHGRHSINHQAITPANMNYNMQWQQHQPPGNNICQAQTMAIPSAILAITSANKKATTSTVVHHMAQLNQ